MFSKPEKLVAYFGIDPSVTQSGQFEGAGNKMSKRGSKLLRKVIFTSAMVSLSKKRNGVFFAMPLISVFKNFFQKLSVNLLTKLNWSRPCQ